MEETGECGENHQTWTGDHYPATCLDPDSNPDRSGDKRVRYPLRYPGPQTFWLFGVGSTVKILLNAHTLINAHLPIWMPQMAILSATFENVGKNPIFLSGKFLTLLLNHITHKSFFFLF